MDSEHMLLHVKKKILILNALSLPVIKPNSRLPYTYSAYTMYKGNW